MLPGPGPAPAHAHLVDAPEKTLMLLLWGRLFLFRGSVSRELCVWMRWAQTPHGYFKAWSQSIIPIQLGRFHVSNGPSPVYFNSSPRIYRPRSTDLCYVIIITSDVHPNVWFIFCAWKQSLYLTIPTHKTTHCYNLHGHKTLMIFCRSSKCF